MVFNEIALRTSVRHIYSDAAAEQLDAAVVSLLATPDDQQSVVLTPPVGSFGDAEPSPARVYGDRCDCKQSRRTASPFVADLFLGAIGAATTATAWQRVRVDLRDDWPTALYDNGFDPELPTAWSAEGLLPFLTGPAQDVLFGQVARLSAPGSRIAVECYRADGSLVKWIERMDQRVRAEAGDEAAEAFSAGHIWYDDRDRTEPVDWFSGRGWRTRSVAAPDYLAQLGRPLAPDEDAFAALANFVVAERGKCLG